MIKEGKLLPGYACDDSVAVLFEDEKYVGAYTSVKGKKAFTIDTHGNSEELKVEFLGK